MNRQYSNAILLPFLVAAAIGLLGGCASVKSTAIYYTPYTAKYYAPKPPDAPIPILGKVPNERHTTIGRLAFETDEGWNFLRKSMIYNAQVNGADAVVLNKVNSRQQLSLIDVPPQVDWVPVPGYYQRCRNGKVYGTTNWVPFFRPGYVQPVTSTITGIDAEMIVLKK
jgi:hypothetical protein